MGEKVKVDIKGLLDTMNEYEMQLSLDEITIFRQVANTQLFNRDHINDFIVSHLEVLSS